MRIFGDLTTPMNSRHNRAAWLTPPFDLGVFTGERFSLVGTDGTSLPLIGTRAGRETDLAAETDILLEASPTGDFLDIFDTFSPTDNASVYNTSCWAASLDFTARAWYCEDNAAATYQAATLVSPRHAIAAEHSNWTAGWKLTWIADGGTSYQRTILDIAQVLDSDIEVLYLDDDLPSTIANCEVLPADYQSYLPTMPTSLTLNQAPDYDIVVRPPAIATCQHRRALVHEVYNVDEWATDKWNIVTTSYLEAGSVASRLMSGDRNGYSLASPLGITTGDSGHPVFMLLGGALVFLYGFTSTQQGPFVTKYIDDINTVMATLEDDNGGSDGYQLTEWTPPTTEVPQAELVGTNGNSLALVGE